MKNILGLLAVALILTFSACEEQPIKIDPAGGGNGPVVKDSVLRAVLIEDLTGAGCSNCPKGTAVIEDMLAAYGKERVIPIGIHGIQLVYLQEAKYNLSSDYSKEIETFYAGEFFGKPAAGFNRIDSDGGRLALDNTEQWAPRVAAELEKTAVLGIEIDHSYDEASRKYDLEVKVTGVEDVDTPLDITVLFAQSKIIDKQKSSSEVIEEYEHNHVLFDGLTPALGESLTTDGISAGEELTKTYSKVLPEYDEPFGKAKDMEVIVFVANGNTDDHEIYNAASAKLIK